MQSDNNEIYKLTTERTGENQDLYKDIGNFVFKALSDNMKKPQSIILKLRGLGYWYLRKNRIEVVLERVIPLPSESEMDISIYNSKMAFKDCLKKRIIEYENYISIRKEVKKIRNEYKANMELTNRKDESSEASKDNME